MTDMEFAEILHELLEERSLWQKDFAAQLNIAPSTLSSYIQGVREPDFRTLIAIAKYFDVSTDYLLGFSKEREHKVTSQQIDLLRIFHALGTFEREMYLEQGKAMLKICFKKDGNLQNSTVESIPPKMARHAR